VGVQLGEHKLILSRIAVENGHRCACARQAQRHGAAYTSIATGHDGDTAGQVEKRTLAIHRASGN
jgi:hypothetical protein